MSRFAYASSYVVDNEIDTDSFQRGKIRCSLWNENDGIIHQVTMPRLNFSNTNRQNCNGCWDNFLRACGIQAKLIRTGFFIYEGYNENVNAYFRLLSKEILSFRDEKILRQNFSVVKVSLWSFNYEIVSKIH